MYKRGEIPFQKDYVDYYFQVNKRWFFNNIGNDRKRYEGMIGRLRRTYASIVREVHLYHVLKEVGYFQEVHHKVELDLDLKIDIVVKSFKNRNYGLQLRTGTKRSDQYADKKPRRNMVHKTDIYLLDMPLNLNRDFSINTLGDTIKLYSQGDAYLLKSSIEKIEQTYSW